MSKITDLILPKDAQHLPGLFNERVKRSGAKTAYQYYNYSNNEWQSYSWRETQQKIALIQQALIKLNLDENSNVAIMVHNCPEWVMFEQAALGLGFVVVPLYPNDRADNIKYIINDADVRVLFIAGDEQCNILKSVYDDIKNVQQIISLEKIPDCPDCIQPFESWIKSNTIIEHKVVNIKSNQLASIVYTSGTTGRPKGVMLSHDNILQNVYGASQCESFLPSDSYLSFLPLSHMFERTVGYYLPMLSGGKVSYSRSIEKLAEDLTIIKPTILVTVPRIFERVYNKIQLQLINKPIIAQKLFSSAVNVGWHWFRYSQNKSAWHIKLLLRPLLYNLVSKKILNKLGGELRLAICGGAALSPEVAKTFIGLGLNISQGYGMTEASPVVSTNLLHDNEPDSVGQRFFNVEVKLGDEDELLVKGPSVMLGYLNNKEATAQAIDKEGWLHTGDKAKIVNEHIYITGRLKDILVLSTGEKVPPNDIEMALTNDPLFEQAIIYGEGKPYLTAIIALNEEEWDIVKKQLNKEESELNNPLSNKYILERIKKCLHSFPGYARIYKSFNTLDSWNVDNGLATPTLKLKRKYIFEKYQEQINKMYKGH